MSVILYDMDKFLSVYDYLKREQYNSDSSRIYKIAKMPDNELRLFAVELQRLNLKAWNERYTDSIEQVEPINFELGVCEPYHNDYQMVKSLQSIYYNTAEAEEDKTSPALKLLSELITEYALRIATSRPEYETAKTW